PSTRQIAARFSSSLLVPTDAIQQLLHAMLDHTRGKANEVCNDEKGASSTLSKIIDRCGQNAIWSHAKVNLARFIKRCRLSVQAASCRHSALWPSPDIARIAAFRRGLGTLRNIRA